MYNLNRNENNVFLADSLHLCPGVAEVIAQNNFTVTCVLLFSGYFFTGWTYFLVYANHSCRVKISELDSI